MAITQYPRFYKGTWVEVINSEHPYYKRLGKVAISGKISSEVAFAEDDGTITQKCFMNRSLAKHEPPNKIAIGDGVTVTADTCPYYSRRGVVRHLTAGNELALVAFGGMYRDEAGNAHEILTQIHINDLSRLNAASAGTTGGGARMRAPQG